MFKRALRATMIGAAALAAFSGAAAADSVQIDDIMVRSQNANQFTFDASVEYKTDPAAYSMDDSDFENIVSNYVRMEMAKAVSGIGTESLLGEGFTQAIEESLEASVKDGVNQSAGENFAPVRVISIDLAKR